MTTVCSADTPHTKGDVAKALLSKLSPDWHLVGDGTALERRISFNGYAKSTYFAGLAVWLADTCGHHPDVSFGWGYFTIRYTSHEAGGLTKADFDCAAKFDAVLDVAGFSNR